MIGSAAHDRDDLLERAGLWCVRLAEGALSLDEEREFDAWINASRANQDAFERASSTWQLADRLKASAELIALRSAALESARRANQHRWARSAMAIGRRPAIAASFILVLLSVSAAWLHYTPRSYTTGLGERRTIVLSDGSRISLDAQTQVDVRFHDGRRQLWLKRGRADFNVAKDPLRPFSVAVGSTVVVATGTEFSVERVGGQVHVVLVEGHVAVLKEQGDVTGQAHVDLVSTHKSGAASVQADQYLTPGRELIVSAQARNAFVIPVDTSRSLSWEAGQLVFADEPLKTAVERVNRYSKSPINVGDEKAAAIPISGVFAAGDTQAFLNGVTAVFPVHIVMTDRGRTLISGGAANN